MLLVIWELVVELLERRTLAHLLEIFDFALRQTALPQILVFFFLPGQVGNRLATLAGNGHINRARPAHVPCLPGAVPESPECAHDSVALILGLRRTAIERHCHGYSRSTVLSTLIRSH